MFYEYVIVMLFIEPMSHDIVSHHDHTKDVAVSLRLVYTQACSWRRRLRSPLTSSSAGPRRIPGRGSLLEWARRTKALHRHRRGSTRRTPTDTSRICHSRPLKQHNIAQIHNSRNLGLLAIKRLLLFDNYCQFRLVYHMKEKHVIVAPLVLWLLKKMPKTTWHKHS